MDQVIEPSMALYSSVAFGADYIKVIEWQSSTQIANA